MNDDSYTITGRRFSKVIHWNESSTQQEIDEAGGFCTEDGALELWKEKAVSILKEKNLPYSALVYYTPGTKKWQIEPPLENKPLTAPGCINAAFMPHSFIDVYILKERKREPYSIEGLAARILTIIEYYKNNLKDPFMLTFELGELTNRLNVTIIESKGGKKAGGHSKQSEPFIKLADSAVWANPDLKNTQYWQILKNEVSESNHYFITTEGKTEYINFDKRDAKTKRIARATFETKYIAPARKRFKENPQ